MAQYEVKKVWNSFHFWTLALLVIVVSCAMPDTISRAKGSHLQGAPNITLEELVTRYQYIDADTITWELASDANKNEYVKAAAHFDNLSIIFADITARITSGMYDVSMLSAAADEYFHNFVFQAMSGAKGYQFNSEGVSLNQLQYNHFEPDYGEPHAQDFFECTGGDLSVYVSVDRGGNASVTSGTLRFLMVSPIDGNDEQYEFIADIPGDMIREALLNDRQLTVTE